MANTSARAPCRVDVATYVGWRVYHAFCATCHAADATGSTFAPDLTDRLRRAAQRDLVARLDELHLRARAPVPLEGNDSEITRYREELWTYLSARARGALPPGSVEPFPPVPPERDAVEAPPSGRGAGGSR